MEKLSNSKAMKYAIKIKALELEIQLAEFENKNINGNFRKNIKDIMHKIEDISEEICINYGEEGLVKVDIKMNEILNKNLI